MPTEPETPSTELVQADLDRLWETIDTANAASPRAPIQFDTVIQNVVAFAAAYSSANAWYAAGYASYMHPMRMPDEIIRQQTVFYLTKAPTLRPGFALPLLYLAYH